MTKAHIFELYLSTIELELGSIGWFCDFWFLLEHIEKVLNVDWRLSYLAEEHSHIEKWTSHLHEVGLQKHEISRRHRSVRYFIGCQEEVQGETSNKDDLLADIELWQRLLNDHGSCSCSVDDIAILFLFMLLIVKRFDGLIVHNRFIQNEFWFLFSILFITDKDTALHRCSLAVVGVEPQSHCYVEVVQWTAVKVYHTT